MNIWTGDIETLKELTLFSFYNSETKEWKEFEISKNKNELLNFCNWYNINNLEAAVYYNGISFDCVVIEHCLRTFESWLSLDNLEITKIIWQYAQDVIDNKNYGVFLQYREEHFSVPCIDVFTINGLENEARRSSLKKIEFQLDWWNVEEMPIYHNQENLTDSDIENCKSYCRNDILATNELYQLTIGNTNHPIYKGNNQIELRKDIQAEFNINCLNYSDIKIGDELMKQQYCLTKGIEINQLPKKGTFRSSISLKDCIPSYIKFKTPTLQKLLKDLKSKKVGQRDKHEVVFKYGKLNTEYTIGLGGGHSTNKNEIHKATGDILIIDLDVSSLYPAIMVNEEYYPKHLGKELLKVYKELYLKRIELKPQSKKDKKIKGICDAIKLILNSFYGKVGSIDSWAYDKKVAYSICLTGQMALFMLIEEMELNGFHCFYFNTDGATFYCDKNKIDKFKEICKEWELKTKLTLEDAYFSKMYFSSVNDYISIKTDNSIKKKGHFISEFELWKNKSSRVVALALEEYFVKGTNPEEFIKNHKNIFDFCIMARAKGDLYLEMQKQGYLDEINSTNKIRLKKLVRYYLTTEKEWQLYKRGIGTTGKIANISLHADNELGKIYIQYYNKHEEKRFEDYKVDVNQYIFKALKIIDDLEKTNRTKYFINSKTSNQLNLFE